jgi:hypothetical protein
VKDADVEKVKAALIEKRVGGFTKVMGVSKLRTKYHEFRDRRALVARYAAFFADKRIVPMLPKLCGKPFFDRRKQPMPVEVERGDVGAALAAARDATWFAVGQQCCAVRVGRAHMEPDAVAENVMAAIAPAVAAVPGKWRGVRSVHLRGVDTPSVPLFKALPLGRPTEEDDGGGTKERGAAAGPKSAPLGAAASAKGGKKGAAAGAALKGGAVASAGTGGAGRGAAVAADFFGGFNEALDDDGDDDDDGGDGDFDDDDDDALAFAAPVTKVSAKGPAKGAEKLAPTKSVNKSAAAALKSAKSATKKPLTAKATTTAAAGAGAAGSAAGAHATAAISSGKSVSKLSAAPAPSITVKAEKRPRAHDAAPPAAVKKAALPVASAHVPPPPSAKPLKSALKPAKRAV